MVQKSLKTPLRNIKMAPYWLLRHTKYVPEVGLQGSEVQCVIIDKSDEIVTGGGNFGPESCPLQGFCPGTPRIWRIS